ncbi:MAG: hypothetical protein MJZ64_08395 [Paludibacteraceae bacterium]|nr:hypothetical protein [Paludibacteraceae bacterium]
MLKHTDCDIAINVDEDCFITNKQAVLDLVNYVIDQKIANAGCPDGGGATPRNGNPMVTNPFFNIFNLRLIREQEGNALTIKQKVKTFNYALHLDDMSTSYPTDILQREPLYKRVGLEPYYPFFFWLAYHFKTLYLPSKKHIDGWTTMLYDTQGHLLCQHSWLSRFYSIPSLIVRHWQPNAGQQKARIDALIAETTTMSDISVPKECFSDTLRYALDKIIRWCIKVPQRIMGWPKKLKKKLFRNS